MGLDTDVHGSRVTYLFLEMIVGEEPGKKDDLNLFSWKEDFVSETSAFPHTWTERLTEQKDLGLSHSLTDDHAQEHLP